MSQKKHKKIRLIQEQAKKKEEVTKVLTLLPIRKVLKENWKFLLVVLLGTFALYLNGLHAHFVSDDYATVTQNPLVTNFGYMQKTAFPGVSTWLLASLFGTSDPFPYHLFSVIIYLFSVAAAFVFVNTLFGKKMAYFSTLLFAVLPIHVEAVTWISGKPYIMDGLAALVTLTFFVYFLETSNKKYLYWMIGSGIFTFWADMVRFPAVIFVGCAYYVLFKLKSADLGKIFKIVRIALGMTIVSLIILWPKINERVGDVNRGYNMSESIFYNPFFQYPTAMAKYLQITFLPFDLTLYHTMYVFPVWLNWAILLTYLGMVVYFWFKDKRYAFSLLFIFLAAAPSMAPVKVSWLVAERYMFLGGLGFCMFLSLLIIQLSKKINLLAYSILSLFLVFYGLKVYVRNIDWQTNHNLWVNTVQVSPNSHNAWNNIGDDYDKLKQPENAIKGFTQSTVVKPNYADAYHNRANIYFKIGRLDLAKDSYKIALQYSPGLFQSYFSMTQIALMEKNPNEALGYASQALKIVPENPQAWYVVGVVYLQGGVPEEAEKAFRQALALQPDYPPAKEMLSKMAQAGPIPAN